MVRNTIAFVLSAVLGLGSWFIRQSPETPPEAAPLAANTPEEVIAGKTRILARYRGLRTVPDILAELDGTSILSGAELEQAAIGLLVARAALIDPQATLDYLIRPEAGHLRRCGYPALLNVWVRQDREGALAAIAAMVGGEIKSELEFKMLHALAEQDPAQAFRVIAGNGSKGDNYTTLNRTYRTFLHWGYQDWDSASAAISEINDPEVRKNALQGLAGALARTDIAAAIDWASTVPGDERESRALMQDVFSQAFLTNSPKAQELLELRVTTLDDDEALRLVGANLHGLLRTDPKRTFDFLTTRFEGTGKEDQARNWLLGQLSNSYPDTAVAMIREHYAEYLNQDSTEGRQVRNAYLNSLCRTDDEQALALLASDSSLVEGIDFRNLNALLVRQDPEYAASFVLSHLPPSRQNDALDHVLRGLTPAEARRWIEDNVTDPDLHQRLDERLERRAASDDPVRFAPLLIDRPDSPANQQLTQTVAFRLAIDDPKAAASWARDISDPRLHRKAVTSIAAQWIDQDSMSAGEWIAGLPPGQTRNEAIQLLIKAVSPVDPEAAAEWEALIVEDPE